MIRCLAFTTLLLLSPLLVALICLVRLSSAGPGLYSQRRLGINGTPFMMWKLRSMYVDAEKLSGPIWSTQGDPRVTPLGRLLRLTHLDELPQLWNVAKGEMALVGPRPERPEIVEDLLKSVPRYNERLQVLPGVTGLAQVYLPPDETLRCVERKLAVDLHYIQTACLLLDARIVALTALRVFGIRRMA